MPVRLWLTSDLHIGMKFAEYPAAQATLVEERFLCLERMVREATERRCDLFVVAGDLFHRVTMSKREVQRAAEALRGFGGRRVVVLPGNHDFFSPDDRLWPLFREASGDAVLFLAEPRPYPLRDYDIDACLYPGPCLSIHSATSAVAWVRGAERDGSARHHIGVAHGSLEGVSPDFTESYFPMKASELLACGMDAWLLGHTHLRFPDRPARGDRIYFPGTPTPDGFDCTHAGTAWLLELGDDREVTAEPIQTGAVRFVEETAAVESARDLEKLEERSRAEEAGRTLLRLHLSGRAPREVISGIGELRARIAPSFLHFDLRSDELREEVTRETIDREFPEASFPHILLTRLLEDPDALQIAYELMREKTR
jgi:DNA repair exonuclease SbcCD nuclease subunit